jgi:hypothetical protein
MLRYADVCWQTVEGLLALKGIQRFKVFISQDGLDSEVPLYAILTYAHVCFDVCSRMRTYADDSEVPLYAILTYALVCFDVCSRMLTYADDSEVPLYAMLTYADVS